MTAEPDLCACGTPTEPCRACGDSRCYRCDPLPPRWPRFDRYGTGMIRTCDPSDATWNQVLS